MSTIIITVLLLLGFTGSLQAATNLTSSVLDGAGNRSTGGTVELISANGQPGGVTESAGGERTLQAGFLNTFSLQPSLDTDSDGLADELDADNDNDGLTDLAEISGSAYGGLEVSNPNNADTDNDGFDDRKESVAGSDPTDDTMFLHLTDVQWDQATDEATVEWQAIGGKSYEVRVIGILTSDAPVQVLGSVAASGGTGPWNVTTTSLFHSGVGAVTGQYYQIAVE